MTTISIKSKNGICTINDPERLFTELCSDHACDLERAFMDEADEIYGPFEIFGWEFTASEILQGLEYADFCERTEVWLNQKIEEFFDNYQDGTEFYLTNDIRLIMHDERR